MNLRALAVALAVSAGVALVAAQLPRHLGVVHVPEDRLDAFDAR